MEETKRVKTEFNIRKAGEGCSGDPQWKKMYVLSKKEKAEVHEDDEDLQVRVARLCFLPCMFVNALCSELKAHKGSFMLIRRTSVCHNNLHQCSVSFIV